MHAFDVRGSVSRDKPISWALRAPLFLLVTQTICRTSAGFIGAAGHPELMHGESSSSGPQNSGTVGSAQNGSLTRIGTLRAAPKEPDPDTAPHLLARASAKIREGSLGLLIPLSDRVYQTGVLQFLCMFHLEEANGANEEADAHAAVEIIIAEGEEDQSHDIVAVTHKVRVPHRTDSGPDGELTTLTVEVNTTGWEEGDYVFVLFAKVVPGDTERYLKIRVPLYLQPADSACMPFIVRGQAKSGTTLLKSRIVQVLEQVRQDLQQSGLPDLVLDGKVGGRHRDLLPGQRTMNLRANYEGSCILSLGAFHIHEPWWDLDYTHVGQWHAAENHDIACQEYGVCGHGGIPAFFLPLWLGIVRDPRDVLLSDFFFEGTATDGTPGFRTFDARTFSASFDANFEEKLISVEHMFASCQTRLDQLDPVVVNVSQTPFIGHLCAVVPYEDLLLRPDETFDGLKHFLFNRGFSSSSVPLQSHAEPLPKTSHGMKYYTKRKGKVGEHRAYFTPGMTARAAALIQSKPHTKQYLCRVAVFVNASDDIGHFC